MQEIINWPPLYRHSIKRSDNHRGHVPNSETSDCWIGKEDIEEWKKIGNSRSTWTQGVNAIYNTVVQPIQDPNTGNTGNTGIRK